ncbi:MAG: type II toxin-antitoxin system HicA family toxin [SAR202 cluster bacterium]|nr:type II toxin-antitoxin system HicA family toxin [SAR202 cluster bacterium]
MRRSDLIKYMRSQGCEFVRDGARHSWWRNPALNKATAVPRHSEIDDDLARNICRDLGIPKVR